MARYRLYGLSVELDFAPRWPLVPDDTDGDAAADLRIELVSEPPAPPTDSADIVWGDDGRSDALEWATVTQRGGVTVVGFEDDADYYLWPDRIVCHLLEASSRFIVETQLLGTVLAVWLARRGVLALHASAVVVDGLAVGFLAMPGGGKTTAALSVAHQGHPVLADDLLALHPGDQQVVAQHGYPLLRLWPQQVERFVGDPDILPRIHPQFEKRRVELEGSPLGFHAAATPLAALCVPAHDEGVPAQAERLGSAAAATTLLGAGFLGAAMLRVADPVTMLARVAAVTDRVPVYELRFPSGLDRVDRLVDLVHKLVRG